MLRYSTTSADIGESARESKTTITTTTDIQFLYAVTSTGSAKRHIDRTLSVCICICHTCERKALAKTRTHLNELGRHVEVELSHCRVGHLTLARQLNVHGTRVFPQSQSVQV